MSPHKAQKSFVANNYIAKKSSSPTQASTWTSAYQQKNTQTAQKPINTVKPPSTEEWMKDNVLLKAIETRQAEIEQQAIQAKLTVGEPGDKYEQEADKMASQVISMAEPAVQKESEKKVQTKPLAEGITPIVQRAATPTNGGGQANSNIESQLNRSKGGGSPLPNQVRSFMEPRFGANFNRVRVHTDSTAVQMNRELGAQAFTHGSDIYYGEGKAPGNNELTAHELTHVVQQTGLVQASPIVQRQNNGNLPNQPQPINKWAQEIQRIDQLSKDQRRTELLAIRTRGEWNDMLNALGVTQVDIIKKWLNQESKTQQGQTLDNLIQGTHNADRARTALDIIDRTINNGQDPQQRLTPRLRELLVLGVAKPKLDDPEGGQKGGPQRVDSINQEGVLTIAQVERAVNALIGMPQKEYMRLSLLLQSTDGSSRFTQSLVLLEAVAARADQFDPNKLGANQPGDLNELEGFSDTIRNMGGTELVEKTSAAQTTAGSIGLTQKFTDSCGPTSAQLIRAEADPIEALRMHLQNELGQNALDTATAREQEAALERHSGQVAKPRIRQEIIDAITNALPNSNCDSQEWMAVMNYLNGRGYLKHYYEEGRKKLEQTMGANFPGTDPLRMVRESAAGIQEGLRPGELVDEANNQLNVDSRTGRTWQDNFSQALWNNFSQANRQINAANMANWRGDITTLLDRAALIVERGNDLDFIVYWHGGGGHFMTFTDVRTVNNMRRFLVHDPWTGTTQWMTQDIILNGGKWPPGGMGLICGLQG
jgi:hypothetical protein